MVELQVDKICKMAVIGSGVTGTQTALMLSLKGFEVGLLDIDPKRIKLSLETIRDELESRVNDGRLVKEEASAVIERISTTTDYGVACTDVDIAFEAVPNTMELKRKVFRQLDTLCPERTILASESSSLLITEIAEATKRPDKVIGMYPMNIWHVTKGLIQVVRGALTSDETRNTIFELAKKLDWIPIDVKDSPGYFVVRWGTIGYVEAIKLFEEGVAGIAEIDEMCRVGCGHPYGPFEMMDVIGADNVYHRVKHMHALLGDRYPEPPLILRKMVLAGYIGSKEWKDGSKGGWYDYFGIKNPNPHKRPIPKIKTIALAKYALGEPEYK